MIAIRIAAPGSAHRLVRWLVLATLLAFSLPSGFALLDRVSDGRRSPTGPPPGLDPQLALLVANLHRNHDDDALVIDGDRTWRFGVARSFRPFRFSSTANANVVRDPAGHRVAFPQLAEDGQAGTLVVRTGVALRELSKRDAASADASFVVPCASTRLASDQTGYVYVGMLAPDRTDIERRIEVGLQLNAPAGGGTPRSVQLYARRESKRGIVATGTGFHVACDRAIRLEARSIGPGMLAFTASGAAIPLRSHRYTVALRLDLEMKRGLIGRENSVERVTALAVPAARNAPLRAGTRLAVLLDRDRRLQGDEHRDAPPIWVRPSYDRVSIDIDEDRR